MNKPYAAPSTAHIVDGIVTHGDKRGRLLGFPTANIPGDAVELEDGVWSGTVQVDPEGDGPQYIAAISLGRRPTYYAAEGARLIEAFLLDFESQIYGQQVRVRFGQHLRSQMNFDGSSELVQQLHLDVADVKTWALKQGLLPADPDAQRNRYRDGVPVRRKQPRDRAKDFAAREEKRNALVSRAVLVCPESELSHAWISSWTGLPLQYILRRYPSIESLRSAAPHPFEPQS